MRMSRASMVLLVAALMLTAAHTAIAQPANASQRAFASARQALDQAIAAHGGLEALRAIKDIQRTGNGTAYNQGQSLRPDTPYSTRTVTVKSVSELAKGRSATETITTPAGGIRTPGRAVLRGDEGFTFAALTNVVSPMSPAALAGAKTALRRDPAAVLLTAAGRAETLRDLGVANFEKRPHRVITFADSDGSQVALYLDAQTHRVAKLETLADNAVLGDTVTETVLSDYRPVNGVQLPHRVVTRVGGDLVQDLQFTEIKVNTSPTEATFDPPAGAVKAKLIAGPGTVMATKLADGVFFVEGSSHNSLAVVLADSILLIEAPLGEERSQAVIAKLAELAPGKPIKAVVATHYHYDHAGGLRTHIARGATIFTTAGNRAFLTKLAATPHLIKPDVLSRAPVKPTIEVVANKKVLGDSAHPVELYDVGPSPHVGEMLVAYLPKDKIVFVSDLFSIPPQGPIPPGTPVNKDFSDKLKKLGLDVQTIAPGHGRIGTMKDLQKALDTPAPN
jgi:glyoxylase-like metal-dependent hydrolase (beta-lactamase superfamily II)